MEHITGIKTEEALNDLIWDIIFKTIPLDKKSPELYEFLKTGYLDYFETKQSDYLFVKQEYTVETPDKNLKDVQTYNFPIETTEGALLGIICKDITEQKQTERELLDSEERFRTLLGNIPGTIYRCACDNDRTMDLISNEIKELTGYPATDFINNKIRSYAGIIHPDDKQRVEDIISEDVKHDRPYTLEYRILHKDGNIQWTHERGQATKNNGGKVLHLDGAIFDITERKQIDNELNRLRNYLQNIIDSMPSLLISVDATGKIINWNIEAEKSTGIRASDAQGKQFYDVLPVLEDLGEKVKTAIQNQTVQAEQKVESFEKKEKHFSDITIYPLLGKGIKGAVIRIDDITERIMIGEIMVQSEKMLSVGSLAAGMAHEINNPLAGILQNIQVLKNRLSDSIPKNTEIAEACGTSMAAIESYVNKRNLTEMISSIIDSGKRASRIVENMLSFSRKSESAFIPRRMEVILDRTLELIQNDYNLKQEYDFRQIRIIRKYDTDVPEVMCEENKIQQVFLNILKNGAEAMSENNTPDPCFTLRIMKNNNMVYIEISNNGPIIEEKNRHKILEPFFTTKTVGKGTGLGLSISYFIIEKDHNGRMEVFSEPGGDTKFVIKLPIERKT